ncbi:tRNA (adenosine(37)-N6)-threonylcarbamoyltransferase complex dimerization subunit type 1 TsaB [Aquincola sp. MAHUQ-54]|uniref:tRNA (Adenosine(37)-N6)-threonylcarbamoyltransferase complex dimerization subunit type 1 TsaB n=1 Tax=Aquincola agrisoli TaxID=3119538 RepID=A0AAW9QDJ8_9BURK
MSSSPITACTTHAEAAAASPALLAIDTSTERLAVAVQAAGREAGVSEPGGALASARLLPVVQMLLAKLGTRLSALDAIAFGQGPGAFTGLRTACAVVQGLALGAGKPVLPVDSLALVAEDARAQLGDAAGTVSVAMDARMDEIYAATYRWTGSRWQVLAAPALWAADALAARWQAEPPACVAGSALAAFGERLPTGAARRVMHEHDRAAALRRLAEQAWHAGLAIDPALALPLYVRDKVALTTAERAAKVLP